MEERDAGHLSKFLDDMMPANLSCQSPRKVYNFWVFWSKERASNHTSTYSDRIKTALSAFVSSYPSRVLVQFWAATTTMTEDGRLTTSDQPFAINCITDEKLIQYKKDCPIYKSVAEDHNLTDGIISRVFRKQLPEISPKLSYYSVQEYPERGLALGCGFRATVVLPVFIPSLKCCVGVLELLFTEISAFTLGYYVGLARRTLQGAGLETINAMQFFRHIQEVHLVLVEEELKGAMDQVCQIHNLPLACMWARSEPISTVGGGGSLNRSYNDSDVNSRRELLVSICEQSYDIDLNDEDDYICYQTHFVLPLTVDQGPVGKVFHSDKPCFCRDVAQLSIIDYPNAHFVRMLRVAGGCFAVCLQSIATQYRRYALEFFFAKDKSHSGDLHNFLSSILTILKQHLKKFEVVTGDIRDDLFTEVGNLTKSNVEASMAKGKNVICAEQSNPSFTYNTLSTSSGHETTSSSREFTSIRTISSLNTYSGYETISSSGGFTSFKTISISAEGGRRTEAEDSKRSHRSRSAESTLNSMRRKPNIYTGPSGNRSYLHQFPSKINEPVDSETGSSYCFKLFGRVMSASQYQVPTMNECRGESSVSDAPRSEGSVVVARTIPPWTMVDVEMITVNENDEEEL